MVTKTGFSLQLKPVGSSCNLRCRYCYVAPFRSPKQSVMRLDIAGKVVRECIEGSSHPTITWHGGEPMMAGLPFFEGVLEVQKRHANGKPVRNIMQTNATLITPRFAKFLSENHFEVGVSLDGSEQTHGMNRVYPKGKNSYGSTMRGLQLL
ncbi:radical SAM protein [Candidatus Parcubacteria bacterium]|nr:radical SAM protein [Patescibacteria group bacterium]MCG2689364.1 radical SAM protein [Candidatus Parcubacteria bacterium]